MRKIISGEEVEWAINVNKLLIKYHGQHMKRFPAENVRNKIGQHKVFNTGTRFAVHHTSCYGTSCNNGTPRITSYKHAIPFTALFAFSYARRTSRTFLSFPSTGQNYRSQVHSQRRLPCQKGVRLTGYG